MAVRWRGVLLGVCVLLASPLAQAESDAPFLWQVKGARTTHYLLGSVHLLPSAAKQLPEGIVLAYRSADVLVFESDTTQLKSRAFSQQMLAAAQAPDVPAPTRARTPPRWPRAVRSGCWRAACR